jgi:hypothetical protein
MSIEYPIFPVGDRLRKQGDHAEQQAQGHRVVLP